MEPIVDARAVSIQEGLIHFEGSPLSGGLFYFEMPGLKELIQAHLHQVTPRSKEILGASILEAKAESIKGNSAGEQFRDVYHQVDYPSYPVGMRFKVSEGILVGAYDKFFESAPSHREAPGVAVFPPEGDFYSPEEPCFLQESHYSGWWYAFLDGRCIQQVMFRRGMIWFACGCDRSWNIEEMQFHFDGLCAWYVCNSKLGRILQIERQKAFPSDGPILESLSLAFNTDGRLRYYGAEGEWSESEFDQIQSFLPFEFPLVPWRDHPVELSRERVSLQGAFMIEQRLSQLSKCNGFDSLPTLDVSHLPRNPIHLIDLVRDAQIKKISLGIFTPKEDIPIYRAALGNRLYVSPEAPNAHPKS